MNFSLYIIGTPDGYDQYPLDSNSDRFHALVSSCDSKACLSVLRNNQLVQYVYVRKMSGEDGSCLGFGFVFVLTGVYCVNCHALNELFETAFYDVLLKGKLFDFQENKFSFQVSRFIDDIGEINRIRTFFESKLESEFKELFVPVPPSFSIGNGETSVSFKDSVSDINSAVESFDVVHITNDEKIGSIRIPNKPKPKSWLFPLFIVAVLFLGSTIAISIVVHHKKEETRSEITANQILNLQDTYRMAVEEFNRKSNLIVHDEVGNEGGKEWVDDAFHALQTIEKCERDPLFSQLSTAPVFESKLQYYREKLKEARDNIYNKDKDDFEKGVSNAYIDRMRERLRYLDEVLEKTKNNSVLDVKI